MQIKNEKQLLSLTIKEIYNSSCQMIRVFGGHLPLLYDFNENNKAILKLDEYRWGLFSIYTFELACKLLRHIGEIGKKGKLILLVDDNIELPKFQSPDGKIKRKDHNKFKKPRKRLMKESKLPDSYENLMLKYKLDKSLLTLQNRDGKKTFLISEKILKEEGESKFGLSHNECSLAYKSLLLNPKYFNITSDLLISFMPVQCKGNICEVLGKSLNINSVHFFFPDINEMGGLIEVESGYLNSKSRMPFSKKEELYTKGIVTYQKNELL